MFGIFKKKAPPPSIELSDEALELIHGGGPPCEVNAAFVSAPHVHSFDARDAVVAVVGGSGSRGSSSRA